MNNNEKIGYYAIIPARVRYDNELPANAKLLYGEITALCNKEGYCWATNDYFANLYGCAKSTISRWVSILKRRGHIITRFIQDKNGNETGQRYIQICEYPFSKTSAPLLENEATPTQKCEAPLLENEKDNNTTNNIMNITLKYNKKKYKTEDFDYDSILKEIEDVELRALFYRFLEMREFINEPMTDYALTLLIKKVEKLEPNSVGRQKEMLETAILNRWKSVYPLKGENNAVTERTGEVQYGTVL